MVHMGRAGTGYDPRGTGRKLGQKQLSGVNIHNAGTTARVTELRPLPKQRTVGLCSPQLDPTLLQSSTSNIPMSTRKPVVLLKYININTVYNRWLAFFHLPQDDRIQVWGVSPGP